MPKWHCGNLKTQYSKWVPKPTSQPAKFLKIIEYCGGVCPSSFYYDNSQISNLGRHKANYLVRKGNGCQLTQKGKNYLKTRKIDVDLCHWIMYNSKFRYRVNPESNFLDILCQLRVMNAEVAYIDKLIRSAEYRYSIRF